LRRGLAALLALCLATVLLGGSLAGAQEEEGDDDALQYLSIQAVDARDEGMIDLVVGFTGPVSALERATIEENGNQVRPRAVEPIAANRTLMVLAVDTSDAMLQGDALTRTKRALQELVENRPQGQRVGIIALGGGARVVQSPTTDTERLVNAIDALAYSGSTSTTSGVDAAGRMIGNRNDELAHLVMIVAGSNTGGVTGAQARGRMTTVGAMSWIIALDERGAGQDEGFLRSVVSSTGGQYFPTANLDALARNLEDVGERIESHYVVSYPSAVTGPVDLTLEAGGQATSVSFVTGSRIAGATALRSVEPSQPGGVAFLRENGQLIGLLAAVIAAVLAAYAIGSLIAPDRSSLDSALEVYTESPSSAAYDDDESTGMATTALIQRAVGFTEQFAERQGFLAKVEATLERADLPLRAAEAMFFYAASVVLLAVFAFAFTGGNLMGTLVVTGLIALLPFAIVSFLAGRRQKKFEELLPDTLNLLAGTLRAGYSLMQGVEAVSREVGEPMGKELRRVVTEARLGRPLEESMEASAERMDSADFAWAVMAIRIQREVGGNLADLLMTVADTMTQRERLRRDVKSLTAEGRMSAIVLGIMPVGLGAFIYTANPEYIGVLFEDTRGQFMLGGAIMLALVGFVWMKKVVTVDV
jgi:tight adherence protein B